MRQATGFSLLELVVTLSIVAILAVIALPQLTDRESQATWFHEQVKAGVRYAQRQAVAQRRCVFVSTSATQVSLFYGDASCAITATPVTQLATGNAYVLEAPTGVAIVPATFSFNGLGKPNPPVTLNIGGKTVEVIAETGYVR